MGDKVTTSAALGLKRTQISWRVKFQPRPGGAPRGMRWAGQTDYGAVTVNRARTDQFEIISLLVGTSAAGGDSRLSPGEM